MQVKFLKDKILMRKHPDAQDGDWIERVLIQTIISDQMKPVRVATDDDKTRYHEEYKAFLAE